MHDFLQISTTTGDRAVAERIATEMVVRRLAACAQVSGPVTSHYHWDGDLETSQEWVCTMKTAAHLFPEIESLCLKLHPYDVPELVATPLVATSEAYASWLRSELRL